MHPDCLEVFRKKIIAVDESGFSYEGKNPAENRIEGGDVLPYLLIFRWLKEGGFESLIGDEVAKGLELKLT